MPNAKVLSEKQATVAALAEKMKNATSGVLVDYKGITVEDDTKLRSELRKANVEYAVVKNTLVRFAANQIGFEQLDDVLHGTTAMAVSMEDPTTPARLLAEFAKTHDKFFHIKAGFLEGKVVDLATVEALAAIPPKDILLSTVLGTMTYSVSSVTKVAVTDTSGLSATAHNQITLYTCVENQPVYRWCVKAVAAS